MNWACTVNGNGKGAKESVVWCNPVKLKSRLDEAVQHIRQLDWKSISGVNYGAGETGCNAK